MQKKLIALAIAGLASTAAFAQTNVTVYGIADGTFDVISVDGTAKNAAGLTQDYDTFTRVSANSSYLGFKGTEDLGNGLKAVFQYELGFDFTSGSSLGGARDSFVGLNSGMGTLLLGNLTGPTRGLGAAIDVNAGATGIGANSGIIGKIGGATFVKSDTSKGDLGSCTEKGQTCTSIFDTRWSNAIAYVSPNIAGFTAAAAYVANENKTKDNVSNTNSEKDTTGYDVGLKWEGGGFMAGVAYNWANIGDQYDTTVQNLRGAAMYTGSNWSIRGMVEMTEAEYSAAGLLLNDFDTDALKYGLGATFTIGKTTLLGQWYHADEADHVKDSGADLFEVGAQYALSKRTMLKAVYAYLDNEDNAAFDFGVNSAGVGAGGTGFGSTVQGLQVGVRHAF